MDKKKQNILIGIISVIGVAIIVLMLFISQLDKKVAEDDNTYTITLKVYYENDELVIDDTLDFKENETLLSLMDRTYEITTRQDAVGSAILSINEYTSDFVNSYFSLYVNGTYSAVGAKDLILTGGLLVEWKWIEL